MSTRTQAVVSLGNMLVVLGVLGVIGLTIMIVSSSSSPDPAGDPSASDAEASREAPSGSSRHEVTQLGAFGVLSTGATHGPLLVAEDEAVFDAFRKAVIAKDLVTVEALMDAGSLLLVHDGASVQVIDRTPTATQVRILEGQHKGLVAWVVSKWVRDS